MNNIIYDYTSYNIVLARTIDSTDRNVYTVFKSVLNTNEVIDYTDDFIKINISTGKIINETAGGIKCIYII